MHLAAQPQWRRLLHIESGNPRDTRSQIADHAFSLAKHGRNQPAAELDADLAAFINQRQTAGEPAACRFHGRYHWLKQQLHFDPGKLAAPKCPKLQAWLAGIDAGRIYVVFASNDLDAPATMFGHTLLRIDQKTELPGARYLAYAVNYEAQSGSKASVGRALKGLTGQYVGYYSVEPYSHKIRSYQGYQHRDLWEYPLKLTEQQKKMLLWHLWALRRIGSPYYFFSHNCSYELLTLLNVAVPKVDLVGPFEYGLPFPHAIPIDTIRVLRKAGLAARPTYEPSLARKLGWDYSQLDASQKAWVRAYIAGHAALPEPGQTRETKSRIAQQMDVAHAALFYKFQVNDLKRKTGVKRDHKLLVARSHIKANGTFPPIPAPSASPDEGHLSGRASIGWRATEGASAALLRWRPAYHDRLDPAPGYLVGSELEFLDLGLLVGPRRVTLSDATIVNVQQIGLRNSLFHPWSWQIAAGARRYGLDARRAVPQGSLGGYIQGGPGMSWPVLDHSQFFVFPTAAIDVNGSVCGDYALGAGIRGGLASQWPRVSTEIRGEWLGDVAGGTIPMWQFRLGAQFDMTRNNGIRIQASYGHQREWLTSVQLLWEHYY